MPALRAAGVGLGTCVPQEGEQDRGGHTPLKHSQGSLLALSAQAALAGLLGSWVHLCTLFGQEKQKEERGVLF